ncbi:MAG: hypothetical protein IJ655_01515 [Lachnospiraceae bacterium]|nr:hypothetical protein [Lachnospiraceae bacterium]
MNTALIFVIVIVALAIFVPAIVIAISDWDYKRQLAGATPERKWDGDIASADSADDIVNGGNVMQSLEHETNVAELKLKGGQNILGPM